MNNVDFGVRAFLRYSYNFMEINGLEKIPDLFFFLKKQTVDFSGQVKNRIYASFNDLEPEQTIKMIVSLSLVLFVTCAFFTFTKASKKKLSQEERTLKFREALQEKNIEPLRKFIQTYGITSSERSSALAWFVTEKNDMEKFKALMSHDDLVPKNIEIDKCYSLELHSLRNAIRHGNIEMFRDLMCKYGSYIPPQRREELLKFAVSCWTEFAEKKMVSALKKIFQALIELRDEELSAETRGMVFKFAARHNDTKMFRALMALGGGEPISRKDRGMAIADAAHYNNTEMVQALIGMGGQIIPLEDRGRAIGSAAAHNNTEMVQALVGMENSGISRGSRGDALISAAYHNNIEIFRALLDMGGQVPYPFHLDMALQYAESNNNQEMIENLTSMLLGETILPEFRTIGVAFSC